MSGIVAYSYEASSKLNKPPLVVLSKVGVFIRVAFLLLPLKSYQVVPLPLYDESLPASRYNKRPSATYGW